jgi:hypothetical protein
MVTDPESPPSVPYWRWLEQQLSELSTELERVTGERDQTAQELEDAKRRLDATVQELERLKARLRAYENPHTPSSAVRFKKAAPGRTGKRGAPKGHPGTTRAAPVPDEDVSVRRNVCPHCREALGEPERVTERVIEDVVPSRVVTTRFLLGEYTCPGCGAHVESRHADCPQKGRFGIGVHVSAVLLKHTARAPIRKVISVMGRIYGLTLSPKAVQDILLRVGDACCAGYNALLSRIRDARWVHIDETGVRVNGKNWWVWVFRTDADDVAVVIRATRSASVAREVLGDDPPPVVADGYSGYNWIHTKQRCWAHLLREVDAHAGASDAGRALADAVHALYGELKTALESADETERLASKDRLEARPRDIITGHDTEDNPELRKPVTYLHNGIGDWFTCLAHPGMPATNNLAEQAVREHVVQRKIIGAFRSERGPRSYACIASLLETWSYQGKDPYEELDALLRRELCLKE